MHDLLLAQAKLHCFAGDCPTSQATGLPVLMASIELPSHCPVYRSELPTRTIELPMGGRPKACLVFMCGLRFSCIYGNIACMSSLVCLGVTLHHGSSLACVLHADCAHSWSASANSISHVPQQQLWLSGSSLLQHDEQLQSQQGIPLP